MDKEIPGLIMKNSVIGGIRTADTILVDCSAAAISTLNKRRGAQKSTPDWCSKMKPYLTSAISGGQWPQAKKA